MTTPSPLAFSMGRHSLKLHGDILLLMPPHVHYLPSDGAFVWLELNFSQTRLPELPRHGHWYPPIEFPVTRLPELRELVGVSIPLLDQLIILGDDNYDVFRFLTDLVNVYVADRMEGRVSAPENTALIYWIRAYLREEEEATFAPPATLPFMLRKVSYRNSNGDSEKSDEAAPPPYLEASCPICLQDFEDGEEANLTPCGHAFHLHCLERWLQWNAQCPLCRSNVPYRL